jgi:hypothetical protein
MTLGQQFGSERSHSSERSDCENGWVNWRSVRMDDDPAAWAEAKDELGL